MPAPEIWGPAVWTLFHTLIEHLNESAFNAVGPQLYQEFLKICKFLPCPECSADATNFLAKVNFSNIKSKIEFRNTFYIFHNWVNAKKRKQLFNYSNIQIYGKYNIIGVINKFISVYHTKGNMKMLNESFQRSMIVSNFKNWFTSVFGAFKQAPLEKEVISESVITNEPESVVEETTTVPIVEETTPVVEETTPVVEETTSVVEETTPVVEETTSVVEEPAPVVEETTSVVEEPAPVVEETTSVVEESVSVVKESVSVVEESVSVVEETAHLVEETIATEDSKKKRGRPKKN